MSLVFGFAFAGGLALLSPALGLLIGVALILASLIRVTACPPSLPVFVAVTLFLAMGLLKGFALEKAADLVAVATFFALVTGVLAQLLPSRGKAAVLQIRPPAGTATSSGFWRRLWDRQAMSSVLHGSVDYLVSGAAAGLASQSWFSGHRLLAFGDFYPLSFSNPDALIGKTSGLWTTFSSGSGGRNFQIVQLPYVLFSKVLQDFGMTPSGSQRLILTVLFVAQAAAAVFLIRTVWPTSRPIARIAGALFYVFNVLAFHMIPGPVQIATFALIPLLAGLMIRSLRAGGRKLALAWAFASLGLSYAAANPPLALVAALGSIALALVVHFIEHGDLRSVLRFVARAGPSALVMNIWWLVPAILTLSSAPLSEIPQATGDWAWTQVRNSLSNIFTLNTAWGWGQSIYYPYSPNYEGIVVSMAVYLPSTAAFGALLFRESRTRRLVPVLAGVCLLLMFLSKGVHSPFSEVNEYLIANVPGFWLLREPALKLLPLVAVLYSLLIVAAVEAGAGVLDGVASEERLSRFGRKVLGRLRVPAAFTFVAMAIAVPFAAFPVMNGAVVADERPVLPPTHVSVPDYWRDAAAALNDQPSHTGALLLLPLNDYYQMPYEWGYYGADLWSTELFERPVIAGQEITYIPSSQGENAVQGLERAILTKDSAAILWRAKMLGVKYILLRGDLDMRTLGLMGRGRPAMSQFEGSLIESPIINRVATFGPLSLWEIEAGEQGIVSAWRDAGVWVEGSGAPPTAVLEQGFDAAILSVDKGNLMTDSAEFAELAASHDSYLTARRRDFVAVRFPIAGEDEVIEGTPHLRLVRSAQVPAIEGSTLYAQLDDRLPSKVVPTKDGIVSMVSRWGGAASVTVTTPGENLVRGGTFEGNQTVTEKWGGVRDCRETKKLSQEHIAAQGTSDSYEGRQALQLTARARLACVSQRLSLKPNRYYAVSFAHKSVRGDGVRACLFLESWRKGGCLDLPPIEKRSGWTRYSTTMRTPRGIGRARLFLYSVADESGRSVVRYDDVAVRVLDPVQVWKVIWKETAERIASEQLDAIPTSVATQGSAQVANLINNSSFERPIGRSSNWSRVGDCNRVAQRPLPELGIAAERVSEGSGDKYLKLTASEHAACVSQTMQVDPGETYRLQLVHKAVSGNPPALCVFVPAQGSCLKMPSINPSRDWTSYEASFKVPSDARSISVFLYAHGGAPEPTVTLYDDVGVTAAQYPTLPLVLWKAREKGETEVAIRAASPSRYLVDVRSEAPFVLTLNQVFDTGWNLVAADGQQVASAHFVANGFANGWLIQRTGSHRLILEFTPERWASRAKIVSLAGLIVVAGLGMVPKLLTRRRVRSET